MAGKPGVVQARQVDLKSDRYLRMAGHSNNHAIAFGGVGSERLRNGSSDEGIGPRITRITRMKGSAIRVIGRPTRRSAPNQRLARRHRPPPGPMPDGRPQPPPRPCGLAGARPLPASADAARPQTPATTSTSTAASALRAACGRLSRSARFAPLESPRRVFRGGDRGFISQSLKA